MRIPPVPYETPSSVLPKNPHTRRVIDIALHVLVGAALLATAALLAACGTQRTPANAPLLIANQPGVNAAGTGMAPAPPGGGVYFDRNSYSVKDQMALREASADDNRVR